MSVVATTSTATVLLWAGSHPAQILVYAAWERMTAKYPSAANGNLGREQGMPELTRTMQDKSHPVETIEVVGSEVMGWVANSA